jgi:hypothetical protein
MKLETPGWQDRGSWCVMEQSFACVTMRPQFTTPELKCPDTGQETTVRALSLSLSLPLSPSLSLSLSLSLACKCRLCVSYLSHHCDQIPGRTNLNEERIYFHSQFQWFSPCHLDRHGVRRSVWWRLLVPHGGPEAEKEPGQDMDPTPNVSYFLQ